MIKTFMYRGVKYPEFIRQGDMAKYISPVAKQVCHGEGIDVGAHTEKWKFQDAEICDLTQPTPWNDAMNLPVENGSQDYVFSSHCLEHIPDWLGALKEWTRVLGEGCTLFLYLPDWECEYWRVSNNPKHLHNFTPKEIKYVLENMGYIDVFASGVDLAYSFAVYGRKHG